MTSENSPSSEGGHNARTTAKPPRPTRDERIDAALLKVMGDGDIINHDRVAEEAGVSRRTVYRRFADQKALRARIWALLTPRGVMPSDLEDTLDHGLRENFTAFDKRASTMVMAMASVEGRTMRNDRKAERVAAYTAMFADTVKGLSPEDARQATAVMQLLCGGFAWLEMHDQWDLDGEQISRASVWAVRALIRDLEARNGSPLDEPLPDQSGAST